MKEKDKKATKKIHSNLLLLYRRYDIAGFHFFWNHFQFSRNKKKLKLWSLTELHLIGQAIWDIVTLRWLKRFDFLLESFDWFVNSVLSSLQITRTYFWIVICIYRKKFMSCKAKIFHFGRNWLKSFQLNDFFHFSTKYCGFKGFSLTFFQ